MIEQHETFDINAQKKIYVKFIENQPEKPAVAERYTNQLIKQLSKRIDE